MFFLDGPMPLLCHTLCLQLGGMPQCTSARYAVQVEHHAQTHMLCSAPALAAEKSSQLPMTLCLKRPRRARAGLPPARAAPTVVPAAPSAKPIRARFAYAIAAPSIPPPCPCQGPTRFRVPRTVVWEALLHRHACWVLRAGFKLARREAFDDSAQRLRTARRPQLASWTPRPSGEAALPILGIAAMVPVWTRE